MTVFAQQSMDGPGQTLHSHPLSNLCLLSCCKHEEQLLFGSAAICFCNFLSLCAMQRTPDREHGVSTHAPAGNSSSTKRLFHAVAVLFWDACSRIRFGKGQEAGEKSSLVGDGEEVLIGRTVGAAEQMMVWYVFVEETVYPSHMPLISNAGVTR
jgi:hypothetical protein